MPKLPLLVLFCVASVSACSSDSGDTPEEPLTNPDNTPGLVSEDVGGNQLSAANYESVVTSGMNLLRASYYPESVKLLEQLADFWGHMRDSVVGSTSFNCPQGGVVTRTVTQAPDQLESGIPDLITKSLLVFDACALSGSSLSGEVQWDWDESSPTQISTTSYHNYYRFNMFNITSDNSETSLDGTHDRLVTVAGTGDSYRVNSVTDSFVQSNNGVITSVIDGAYNQQFRHFIAQSGQVNNTLHEFSESGTAKLKIDTLGLVGATISVEPEMVYENEQTAGSFIHSSRLASGKLEITLPNTAALEMTTDTGSTDSVRYSIISPDQQETVIEREWLAPAVCRNDENFNYESC